MQEKLRVGPKQKLLFGRFWLMANCTLKKRERVIDYKPNFTVVFFIRVFVHLCISSVIISHSMDKTNLCCLACKDGQTKITSALSH